MSQRVSHSNIAEMPRFAGRDQAALKELRKPAEKPPIYMSGE